MPVAGRLSKTVVKAVGKDPSSKIQAPEKFEIPRSNYAEPQVKPGRRGEDTAPYLIAKIDLIRRGCVGRFLRRLATSQIREYGEAVRRGGLERCR
jgi:hypothetical protein